jgi:K+-sensing histidine kinase KdpD
MKYSKKIKRNQKSVQSVHLCKSVIETSYDIIKAHGGEIKVEIKEGQGTNFILNIPILTHY